MSPEFLPLSETEPSLSAGAPASIALYVLAFCFGLLITRAIFAAPQSSGPSGHPWPHRSTELLAERFPTPAGAKRIPLADHAFGSWLRNLPVRKIGTPVHLHDGRQKPRQDVHVAVIDIDVGKQDLQQCADAVMRLRAEFLWAGPCRQQIAFNFTSGDRASWFAWSQGSRPRIAGNSVNWHPRAEVDPSYGQFRSYLNTVFTYAGTHSLSRELKPVTDPSRPLPGDVFIQGGFPGHAVIVLDVAETTEGERLFLLGQSYMPAQDIHVLKNPLDSSSPWFRSVTSSPLITPEWRFEPSDLKRFKSPSCGRARPSP